MKVILRSLNRCNDTMNESDTNSSHDRQDVDVPIPKYSPICFHGEMVSYLPSKQVARVRFPMDAIVLSFNFYPLAYGLALSFLITGIVIAQ